MDGGMDGCGVRLWRVIQRINSRHHMKIADQGGFFATQYPQFTIHSLHQSKKKKHIKFFRKKYYIIQLLLISYETLNCQLPNINKKLPAQMC